MGGGGGGGGGHSSGGGGEGLVQATLFMVLDSFLPGVEVSSMLLDLTLTLFLCL